MPNARKKAAARPACNRTAKVYWLPMPRRQAESIVLQYRIAIEAFRNAHATQMEAQHLAQAVLLTNMLTQVGYGRLEHALICTTEEDVLAMLERGGETGEWTLSDVSLARLTAVINEHDRQLHEVHLAALIECNERLKGFIHNVVQGPAN
ncbi:Fis family transcriptional regulator [Caballeronia sp. BR00000012568055]|uniref:Fis family transcriptional regulator n=1 Tax=Caballeronia sp. BR00000012568055 TaxID=2918761 RepID=UPI0023F8AFDB|nr:Fis family transcriptional regulator [Caballeronia sp. BR00000012568055]